jgi:predicted Fe-S protein YdhL (DUF1289 family)
MFSDEIKLGTTDYGIMSLASTTAEPAVASPCNGVCLIGRSGYCLGCARTLQEIAAWTSLSPGAQLAVIAQLLARKAAHPQELLARKPPFQSDSPL